MITRSHAKQALDAAFDAHLAKLLDVFAISLGSDRLEAAAARFDIGWSALLKAHTRAEQTLYASLPDDKSESYLYG